MSAQPAYADFQSSGGVVVSMSSYRGATAGALQMARPSRAETLEDLIARIEALGYMAVAATECERKESPFDAIYLSALTPDPVPQRAAQHLARFARIEDRSHEIVFNDGLD